MNLLAGEALLVLGMWGAWCTLVAIFWTIYRVTR